jgi:hypothetical protein
MCFLCMAIYSNKMKLYTLALCCLILPAFSFAQVKENLSAAQKLVAETSGEDSLNVVGSSHPHTVISGYGELAYQRNNNAQTATVNLNRAVIFVGHQFSSRIAFFSELEVENAKVEAGGPTGEVGFEQCYIKFAFNSRQYLVAGLFVPRIGIINESHLPVSYNGMERPMVEQLVIPSTWREMGVGFYGQSSAIPITYSVALLNALNNANFVAGTGIREGRMEGQFANANNLALTASLQYYLGNWKLQASGYIGGSTGLNKQRADSLGLNAGPFANPVFLAEANAQYQNKGWALRLLTSIVNIPDAQKINTAYNNNTPIGMYGSYAELGYNLLEKVNANRWRGKQLVFFIRGEILDLNANVPKGMLADVALFQKHIVTGFSYLPLPNVVIKADVRFMHLNVNPIYSNPNNSFINFGIGYSF